VILLDTDHLTLLKYPQSSRCAALTSRMETSPDRDIATTIISVEEQWRGWFAVIARYREVERQVTAYRELMTLLEFLSRWTIVPFDERAAGEFGRLRQEGVRLRAMDLKIASIALAQGEMVLSANLSDFL
jgi:tRNA(fMet)-specific endonuclease VapC